MKTAPTNKKVRELISLVKEGKLIPRPEFQRRLVWSRDDKNHFLDTVLRGYPFPEIYFADGDVDLETGEGTQLLVDGLQRVSTLIQYFDGDPDLRLTTIKGYKELDQDGKRAFLQYDVAVRDLGSLSRDEIIEVFRRLNATKYSLLDIEVNNAVYAGKLKSFCEDFAQSSFFEQHKVFNALDYKRMGDLRFALSIVATMLQGYFNRDDAFEELLSRYNDDFPVADVISARITDTIDFIEECGFPPKSRVWKKADLFTLFSEIDRALHLSKLNLQPNETVESLEDFYQKVEESSLSEKTIHGIYYKAAIQASNDRINRVRRGLIVDNVIRGLDEAAILVEFDSQKL
ncbi:DUF262 domain-containing protein [Nodosilinea sp. PGN35]|uniref:DUF262 domain-containing protein n=1 Tax=Nodosilinea sp. PGN35 TaxID=3020489 RepID=UPI0023B26DB4|nr:DUF262 domain-containing protein [Nodosilinea sp. TSF1-S3]MDF0365617.1 DUF262 domain-containing protein [Nodosilinea sp. TSF1-S3]